MSRSLSSIALEIKQKFHKHCELRKLVALSQDANPPASIKAQAEQLLGPLGPGPLDTRMIEDVVAELDILLAQLANALASRASNAIELRAPKDVRADAFNRVVKLVEKSIDTNKFRVPIPQDDHWILPDVQAAFTEAGWTTEINEWSSPASGGMGKALVLTPQ